MARGYTLASADLEYKRNLRKLTRIKNLNIKMEKRNKPFTKE